jgi:lipid II:glycine glycyltransferase (peptidoglycan interpeptide bridge formation enzyme)
LEYYRDFYDVFNKKNMFHIYFAKINPLIYLQNSKRLFDKEQINNAKIIIKSSKHKNNFTLINKKMESDKLLNIYKNDIIKATNLATNYPKGILIGTNAVVVYKDEVLFLIDGYDKNFENIPANYLLKHKIIENFMNKGYKNFNFNGITGDFSKENKYYGLYKFKAGFNTDIIEYIGEFDLIINNTLYQMYTTIPSLQQYLKK